MAATDPTRQLIDRLYSAFGSGDAFSWMDNLADDVIDVGSDPGEWWGGRERVAEVVTAQAQEMSAPGLSVHSGQAVVKAFADTVLVADQPILQLSDGTQVALRFSLVTTEQDGNALIRHFHLSVGAAIETVVGAELTRG